MHCRAHWRCARPKSKLLETRSSDRHLHLERCSRSLDRDTGRSPCFQRSAGPWTRVASRPGTRGWLPRPSWLDGPVSMWGPAGSRLMVRRRELQCGGDEETRTPDPLLAKEMLCQLSYVPRDETTKGRWWAFLDSNQRPLPYQGSALTS